jgi:hypothetical protein
MRRNYSAKAGRFVYDQTTKKVKVSKEKGILTVYVVKSFII